MTIVTFHAISMGDWGATKSKPKGIVHNPTLINARRRLDITRFLVSEIGLWREIRATLLSVAVWVIFLPVLTIVDGILMATQIVARMTVMVIHAMNINIGILGSIDVSGLRGVVSCGRKNDWPKSDSSSAGTNSSSVQAH